MRVPWIVAGPGIAANQRTNAMCHLFDVLPTLGELCGVSAPKTSEGLSFPWTLRDPAQAARADLIFAYRDVQRAVRGDRWKLIRYPKVDKTQLFDLQHDPDETTNLAEKAEHAPKVAELTTLLEKEMRRSGDSDSLHDAKTTPAEWTPPASKRAP